MRATSRPAEDRQLVIAARAGDEAAAEAIVRHYFPQAFRAAFVVIRDRHRAEDAVQEAFERFFQTLDRFDETRPIAPWLHRMVVNTAISATRSRAQSDVPYDDSYDLSPNGRWDGDTGLGGGDVAAAVQALDLDRRVVVVLRLLLGYTAREVSEMLGVPKGTVDSRLSRALGDLRAALRQ